MKLSDFMLDLLSEVPPVTIGAAHTAGALDALAVGSKDIETAMHKLVAEVKTLDRQRLEEKAARAPAKTIVASTPSSESPGLWDKLVVEKSRQSGLTAWPGVSRSEWEKEWLTTPVAETAEQAMRRQAEERELRADRVRQREKVHATRVKTVHYVAQHHRSLLGVRMSRMTAWQMDDLGEQAAHEGMIEILNKANFRRERYGYENHRGYQDHLEGLVNAWSEALHAELITNVEANDEGKRAEAKRWAEEQLRAADERQRQEQERARQRALQASDPVDALPEGLDELLELEAARSVGRAPVGVW